jgi:myo-inositol-1(or 4)-monophosphatase
LQTPRLRNTCAPRVADGSDPARLIGEESADGWTQAAIDTALTGATWVVDPIDGTAPYANQLPTWGISLGLMVDGVLTDGALFLPRTGEMFITSGEDVLFERGARNPEYWRFDALAPLRPDLRAYDSTAMVSLPREIIHTGRFSGPNPIQSNGSAVYSIAKLLTGSYICYVARVKLWTSLERSRSSTASGIPWYSGTETSLPPGLPTVGGSSMPGARDCGSVTI